MKNRIDQIGTALLLLYWVFYFVDNEECPMAFFRESIPLLGGFVIVFYLFMMIREYRKKEITRFERGVFIGMLYIIVVWSSVNFAALVNKPWVLVGQSNWKRKPDQLAVDYFLRDPLPFGTIRNDSDRPILVMAVGPNKCIGLVCKFNPKEKGVFAWTAKKPPRHIRKSKDGGKIEYVVIVTELDWTLITQQSFAYDTLKNNEVIFDSNGLHI